MINVQLKIYVWNGDNNMFGFNTHPLKKPTLTIKPKRKGPTLKQSAMHSNKKDVPSSPRPNPPEPILQTCKHEYAYQESVRTNEPEGAWNIHWKKVNIYYCIHCLEQKHTTDQDWSREKPSWY